MRPVRIALLASAIYASALLALIPYHELGGFEVETDFYGRFLPEAQALLSGRPTVFPITGPGYPALLAMAGRILGDFFRAGQIVSALSAAVAGFFAFRLGESLAGPRVGLWLQALLLFGIARFAVLVSTETFFVALVTATLYFAIRHERPTPSDLLAAGLLSGWATITRYNGLFLVAFGLLVFAFLPLAPATGRGRSRNAALFVLGFFLTSSWWWILNARWNGGPFASQVHLTVASLIYGRGAGDLEDLASASLRFDSLWSVLSADPLRTIRIYLGNLGRCLVDLGVNAAQPPALAAFLFGLATATRTRRDLLLLGTAVLGILPLGLVPRSTRYLLPILPIVYFYAALVLGRWTSARKGSTRSQAKLGWAVALGVVFTLLATAAWKVKTFVTTEPVELLAAADAVRSDAGNETRVLVARKPHLAVLSGQTGAWPAGTSDEESFFRRIAELRADYLFVGHSEVGVAPFLRGLPTEDRAPVGWRVLARDIGEQWVLFGRAPG